jgi:hypothetical protein
MPPEQWSNYYPVVEKGTRTDATLGGEPAMQLVHPVRIRPSGPAGALPRRPPPLSLRRPRSMPAGAADRDAVYLVAFQLLEVHRAEAAPGDEPPQGSSTAPGRPTLEPALVILNTHSMDSCAPLIASAATKRFHILRERSEGSRRA